jgi:hypothetical protein
MTNLVYAKDTCSVVDPNTGLKYRLVTGETWDADDPLVKALPHLFSKTAQIVRTSQKRPLPAPAAPVEKATAEPGAKRPVNRVNK